jgi:hypothetical protein
MTLQRLERSPDHLSSRCCRSCLCYTCSVGNRMPTIRNEPRYQPAVDRPHALRQWPPVVCTEPLQPREIAFFYNRVFSDRQCKRLMEPADTIEWCVRKPGIVEPFGVMGVQPHGDLDLAGLNCIIPGRSSTAFGAVIATIMDDLQVTVCGGKVHHVPDCHLLQPCP